MNDTEALAEYHESLNPPAEWTCGGDPDCQICRGLDAAFLGTLERSPMIVGGSLGYRCRIGEHDACKATARWCRCCRAGHNIRKHPPSPSLP